MAKLDFDKMLAKSLDAAERQAELEKSRWTAERLVTALIQAHSSSPKGRVEVGFYRIKPGTTCFQDFKFFNWPEEMKEIAFVGRIENDQVAVLIAPNFGLLTVPSLYGSGSIRTRQLPDGLERLLSLDEVPT